MNQHKRCEYLARFHPPTFWVVSRDRSDVFWARYPGHDRFDLISLADHALKRSSVWGRSIGE